MVLPPSAKLAMSGAVAVDVEFGQSIALGKDRAGDDRIVEVDAVLAVGDHRLALKGEADMAGLGRNGRIYRRWKADGQLGWSALVQIEREANRDIADEHATGCGMQLNWLSQQLAQDFRRGAHGHVAAAVLQNEIGGKLVVAAQNFGFVFAFVELRLDRVTAGRRETELVLLAVGLSLDIAERLE